MESIYEVPIAFHEQGLDDRICAKLGIWAARARLEPWVELLDRWEGARQRVKIAIVGKYVHLADTYKSLNEALFHGATALRARAELVHIDSEQLDINAGRMTIKLPSVDWRIIRIAPAH